MPTDQAAAALARRAFGAECGVSAMVGDGINDAPAPAGADGGASLFVGARGRGNCVITTKIIAASAN